MKPTQTLTIDGFKVPIQGERNLLEVIRKAHIELPTFCYHSELSIYGACRLCMVDVEGRGMVASCSTLPEPGMRVRTQTAAIRELRKVNLELLLASGDHDCPTCAKSGSCKLQSLAQRLGVDRVRFHAPRERQAPGPLQPRPGARPQQVRALRRLRAGLPGGPGPGRPGLHPPRRPGHRGPGLRPAHGRRGLRAVRPVRRGLPHRRHHRQAGRGAGPARPSTTRPRRWWSRWPRRCGWPWASCSAWPTTAHIMGRAVAALRRLGFAKVYDTAFAADLTIMEEAQEFLTRRDKGENLPLFTSCCPAWVQFAEQEFAGGAAQPLHLPQPPADVRLPGQGDPARPSWASAGGPGGGLGHALHRQEVRSPRPEFGQDGSPTWTSSSPPRSWAG